MAQKKKAQAKNSKQEKNKTSDEVRSDFEEASQIGSGGEAQMIKKIREHNATSPALSGGDVDAAWEDADVGEESVGGGNPTPDQNVVDELGEAMGVNYEDGEPLHTEEKLEDRDKNRWELNPASSEGFDGRMNHEGEYEEK